VQLALVFAFLMASAALAGVKTESAPALMPMPAEVRLGEGKLLIDASFSIRMNGYSDQKLQAAASRLTTRISRQTGIPITGGDRPVLTIECRAAAPETPRLGEDESYQLDITPKTAHLSAHAVTGALRGMETFSQLIVPGADSFFVPALHIEDRPRFAWRGLMLDVARHWMPTPVILRNLDAMAAVKLNVLHWHLSDDQGFRVESQRFPKLQELGSDGNYYTQAEIRRVVAYAGERGIRVVPEFDIPGHATSWLAAYPELGSAPGPFRIERKWGIFEPTLDPTREDVYAFLGAFFGEVAGLFPDEYVHIGGDEVLDNEWRSNAAIQQFCRRNGLRSSVELHAYFNRKLQKLLEKHGKKMMGWDEVLSPALEPGVVIQSWRGQQSLADAARKGYRGVLSFGYYLNYLKPAAFHYQVDPLGDAAKELDGAQAALITGGEACMWAEYITEETIDSRLWPRAAAIAERLWSPATVTDADSMYNRLGIVSRWLEYTGVRHRSDYQPLLDRLAGTRATPELLALADAVEALGLNERQVARHYSSFVPLNRLVDAARPESERIREIGNLVNRLLADPSQHRPEAEEIRLLFSQWSLNNELLQPLLESNFLLKELEPLSANLSRTGNIGLQALQYLASGVPAPPDWVAKEKQELSEMEESKAEVVLAAVRPVRALVEGISKPSAGIAGGRGFADK